MSSDSNSGLQSRRPNPRRSQRLYVRIRVRREWRLENNSPFTEETETLLVNAHGALVSLDAVPQLGQKVVLQNASTNVPATVLRARRRVCQQERGNPLGHGSIGGAHPRRVSLILCSAGS
jgi:hypothetical protein